MSAALIIFLTLVGLIFAIAFCGASDREMGARLGLVAAFCLFGVLFTILFGRGL